MKTKNLDEIIRLVDESNYEAAIEIIERLLKKPLSFFSNENQVEAGLSEIFGRRLTTQYKFKLRPVLSDFFANMYGEE